MTMRNSVTKEAIEKAIRTATAPGATKDIRLTVGEGLFCLVKRKTGVALWRYKYAMGGKDRTITLGRYADGIGQQEAKALKVKARQEIIAGRDPVVEKRKRVEDLGKKNFEVIAREWWRKKSATKNWVGKYKADVIGSLETYAFGGEFGLGRMNVDEIDASDVTTCLERYCPKPFRRDIIRRRLVMIFEYATKYCKLPHGNPALTSREVFKVETAPSRRKMPAVVKLEPVVEILQRVDGATEINPFHRLCLRWIALTACRPHNGRLARWDELSQEGDRLLWTVPKERMKMKGEDREDWVCPLSPAAVAILDAVRPFTGHSPFIFPRATDSGQGLNANACNRVLTYLGLQGVHCAHGFRSSFASIMSDYRGHSARDLIELQLAHDIGEARDDGRDGPGSSGSNVRKRYVRAMLLEGRGKLVDEYAELIASTLLPPEDLLPKIEGPKPPPIKSSNVVPFRKVA